MIIIGHIFESAFNGTSLLLKTLHQSPGFKMKGQVELWLLSHKQ